MNDQYYYQENKLKAVLDTLWGKFLYGKDMPSLQRNSYIYSTHIENIKKLENSKKSIRYIDIDENNRARKTLTGGLKLRRKGDFMAEVKFSKEEFERIISDIKEYKKESERIMFDMKEYKNGDLNGN